MEILPGPLLQTIDSPQDLKRLQAQELEQLCDELRQYIIDVVSVYGGHFAAGLGVVELTVALHRVFNAPQDQMIWDVGHQAYAHKIITGRRDVFTTNRKYGGLSGFPKRNESPFDAFGTGHSSTSVSAALGMAMAAQCLGKPDQHHIAVIGDGALTAGMAFEGLNHAGDTGCNLLIILNDNRMSIDPNVGALMKQPAAEIKNFFNSLNLPYDGPVDGHDMGQLLDALASLKSRPGPKVLHVQTVKGKGYTKAEEQQTLWHAPGQFDKLTGEIYKKNPGRPQAPRYQDVFGHTLLELATMNDRIMGITPAMPSGSSLKLMMDAMPDRAIDVGIAEQHAVTLSAGMATQGLRVFCNIYSSFMQRAYDQVIHDVAIQDLPVVFCLDRAGLVGEDGPTHHGAYDLAYMRCIPNLIVSAPMNEHELRNLMYTAQLESTTHPFVIRYPRGQGVMPDWHMPFKEIKIGQGRKLKDGREVAILSIGHAGNFAADAILELQKEGIDPAHYDLRFVKPLDAVLLEEVFHSFSKILTVEDGTVEGGFGSAILEFMNSRGFEAHVSVLGIPDEIMEHGTPSELYAEAGIDAAHIARRVRQILSSA